MTIENSNRLEKMLRRNLTIGFFVGAAFVGGVWFAASQMPWRGNDQIVAAAIPLETPDAAMAALLTARQQARHEPSDYSETKAECRARLRVAAAYDHSGYIEANLDKIVQEQCP